MVKISEIVSQNPWWKHGKNFANFDKHLSDAKQGLIFFRRGEFEASRENIYVVRGCRQVGKTTYLKERIRNLLRVGLTQNAFCTFRWISSFQEEN